MINIENYKMNNSLNQITTKEYFRLKNVSENDDKSK